MLFLAMALWAFLVLVVTLGVVVNVSQTARWLETGDHQHHGGWLAAGTALEVAFALLLLWLAWRTARMNGASFLNAVTFRGGANRYEAVCLTLPISTLLLAAAVRMIWSRCGSIPQRGAIL